MTDQPDPTSAADAPAETPPAEEANPTDVHRMKQRRLLFAIELTLFGLVLLLSGSVQAGFLVAVFGLLIGVSGL